MEREERSELLDLGAGNFRDVQQNLREIERINDWLGGTRALTGHLYPLLVGCASPVRIVDAGTGNAGLARAIVRWAARRGQTVCITALDWAWRNLRAAAGSVRASPQVSLVQGDARWLPFCPGSVDFVISQLLMHHLPPGQLAEMLHHAFTCARYGIVMCDLVRGQLPYLAYHLVMPFAAHHRFTREDGLTSIRRAYTPGELRTIARSAGLPNPMVYSHWPWRMTLVALK